MKKLYTFALATVASFAFGQNLLVNGDLEAWDDATTPTGWTKAEALNQEATEVHGGSYSAFRNGGSGTKDLAQTIMGITPGKTYNISFWYKSGNSDASDTTNARIWSYWRSGGDASVNNVTDAATDAALRGPNNVYLDDNGGVWTQYSVDVVAPATTDRLYFEVRSYTGSQVYWDDMSVTCTDCNSTTPTLSISSPANATVFAPGTTSVDVTLLITNFNVANGTGDGHIGYFLNGNTANITYVYDASTPISLSGLTAGSHTLAVALLDNANMPLSPAVYATVTFEIATYTQVATIKAIRDDVIANGDGKYYELTTAPTVTYARTARNQKYIQDATAGILIDDTPGTITTTFAIGDTMTGLKGKTSTYNGVLQFNPLDNATAATGTAVTPEVVTVADIIANVENYESELVQINGATFADGNGTATFAVNTNYNINDGTTMIFRTMFAEANYVTNTDVIPSVPQDLVVLVAEFNGTIQVVARSLADMTLKTNTFNAIDGLAVYPNPVSGDVVTITSAANEAMQVQLFDVLGKQIINTNVTNNTINVATLDAGIYFIKITEAGKTATRKLIVK